MVQISIGRHHPHPETDVRKCFVVNAKTSSADLMNWWTDKVQLNGSTAMSETFGDGTIEQVDRIPSGYSSRRMLSSRMPRPEPMLLPSQ
jgi:hypothetical protein